MLVDPLDARFQYGKISKEELGLKRGNVARRIDRSIGMRNRLVGEEPDNLDEGIVGANVGEEVGRKLR